MSIFIEEKELKKLVNILVMGVFENLEKRNLMAGRGGFEPPVSCPTAAFQATGLNHSPICPFWIGLEV